MRCHTKPISTLLLDRWTLSGNRETHVPELIRHTRERRPEPWRAHFGKLDRNNTPCTLYTELDTERASGESREAAWDDPERNEGADEEGEADDGESAT